MVLAAGMVGREMDSQLSFDRADHNVALVADIVQPLVVIGSCREDVPMAAGRRPFRSVEQQQGVGPELRISPGVSRNVAIDVVVVVRDADIVHTH